MAKNLKELRHQARRVAGLTSDADAVPDDLVTIYINEAVAALYDLIIDADDGRIFAKNATKLPKVGTHAHLLPSDLYRLIGVDVWRGSRYVPAKRAPAGAYATLADDTHLHGRPQYEHRWDMTTGTQTLMVFPEPDPDTVAILYFPRPPELTADADSLDNPAQWLSFVAYSAAVKMLNQLERDASPQLLELKMLGQRIEDAVNDLDVNSPPMVRDLDSEWYD